VVNARRQLETVLGRRLAEVVALIRVLRRSSPHQLVLDGRRGRRWLYFAGNCPGVPLVAGRSVDARAADGQRIYRKADR
jgi:hypothetical protein